jgi:multiple sugar transport system substrate-binding protein
VFERLRARSGRSVSVCPAIFAIAVLAWGCGSSTPPTASPTATATASAEAVPITIRWYLGFTLPASNQMLESAEAFARRFNESQDEIVVEVEAGSAMDPLGEFSLMVSEDDPPEIVGPAPETFLFRYQGAFLDLEDEIAKQDVDLAQVDPQLIGLLRLADRGQIALPYTVSPGFIFYNKDLFSRAGLPDLPKRVGETYMGKPWDWNALGDVAALMTRDKNGRNASDGRFDPAHVVQWGFDFNSFFELRIASSFGAGSLLAQDGRTTQVPEQWRVGWRWYYDAIWTRHVVPTAAQKEVLDPNSIGTAASGRVAMAAAFPWAIPLFGGIRDSIDDPEPSPAFANWDMAVMPSWEGEVSSPTDVDAFALTAKTRHPDEAFRVMTAIMADPGLRTVFDDMPADRSARAAYYARLDAELAGKFPGNTVSWSVLDEMAAHPAVPHPEAEPPYLPTAYSYLRAFYGDLTGVAGLDLDARIDALLKDLQYVFGAAPPIAAP